MTADTSARPALRLRVERYRALVLVAETGDVAEAARRLGQTRRAVRRDLRRLEESARVPLLERRRGRIGTRLTAAGEAFLPYAQLVVDAGNNVSGREADRDLAPAGVPDP